VFAIARLCPWPCTKHEYVQQALTCDRLPHVLRRGGAPIGEGMLSVLFKRFGVPVHSVLLVAAPPDRWFHGMRQDAEALCSRVNYCKTCGIELMQDLPRTSRCSSQESIIPANSVTA
jgi:hypothetical protein